MLDQASRGFTWRGNHRMVCVLSRVSFYLNLRPLARLVHSKNKQRRTSFPQLPPAKGRLTLHGVPGRNCFVSFVSVFFFNGNVYSQY